MKIGELAKQSGIAASRIRFYEASGLLQTAQRQANGYREYPPETLLRLQIILRAQGTGFTLDEIRAILPPDLGEWQHDTLVQTLQRKVDEIEQLEKRLAKNKRDLRDLIAALGEKRDGEDCSGKAGQLIGKMQGRQAAAAKS